MKPTSYTVSGHRREVRSSQPVVWRCAPFRRIATAGGSPAVGAAGTYSVRGQPGQERIEGFGSLEDVRVQELVEGEAGILLRL